MGRVLKDTPVILVSGCHIGDCHYIAANHWTQKRIEKVHKRMEKLRQSVSETEIIETIEILKNREKSDPPEK